MKSKVMFLTRKKAKEWKSGVWKYTYTNFLPKVKYLQCFSGDYIYIIKLTGIPKRISLYGVPVGYRSCLIAGKRIFKTPAVLVRIKERKLRRSKTKEEIEELKKEIIARIRHEGNKPFKGFGDLPTGRIEFKEREKE